MNVNPVFSNTEVIGKWVWRPADFQSFVCELENISTVCHNAERTTLYRGHRDSRWLLESTFARFVKQYILGISPIARLKDEYRLSLEFHRLIGGLFLYKFGTSTLPHPDLVRLEEEQDIDSWFEWMKKIQQNPEVDLGPMEGTFLIDWSQRADVAVYFANEGRHRDVEGAVWAVDITALGMPGSSIVHQDMKVAEILGLFQDAVQNDKPVGIPLVFCPRKQIASRKARNQNAIYVAQMDLRCDFADIWAHVWRERRIQETVFLKLLLPKGTVEECSIWLHSKGITEDFIYPTEERDPNTSIKATGL